MVTKHKPIIAMCRRMC